MPDASYISSHSSLLTTLWGRDCFCFTAEKIQAQAHDRQEFPVIPQLGSNDKAGTFCSPLMPI